MDWRPSNDDTILNIFCDTSNMENPDVMNILLSFLFEFSEFQTALKITLYSHII